MEVYGINPIYKSLMEEQFRQVPTVKLKNGNIWKKSVLALGIVGLMLTVAGIPLYDGVFLAEGSVIPVNLGALVQTPLATSESSQSGTFGDIVWYELTHWGANPTVSTLASIIAGGFVREGLGYITADWPAIAGAILDVGVLGDGTIAAILAGLISNPVGWGILLTIAAGIVAF